MSERHPPEKIKSAGPFHSGEEIMEIPATKDGLPKFSRDSDEFLQASHGDDRKSGNADVHGFGTRHTYWGEEMSGVPRSRNLPLSRMETSCTPYRRERCSTSSMDRERSREIIPSPYWGELMSESPATNSVGRFTQESYQGSKESGDLDTESVSHREEVSTNKESHCDAGSLQFVGSKMETSGALEEDDPAVLAMFHAVATSRLAVRSQQKDEPDFTPAQKLAILRDLYHTKPLVFLERFRTALREEHLSCFHHLYGHYEADFYCAEVRRAALGKTQHTRVRNKRYAALQQLIQGGEYFSDEQMRSRDPLLYEQYIGQYLSDEEMQTLGSCKLEAACSLSGALLDSYQEQVIQQRLQVQQEQEEACEEEEEDDSDRDGEDQGFDSEADEWVPSQEEKAFLREEFTSRMYQRFLDGRDRDFDYSEVDENPDFDNLDIVSRDEEERYFDGEEPEVSGGMETEESLSSCA